MKLVLENEDKNNEHYVHLTNANSPSTSAIVRQLAQTFACPRGKYEMGLLNFRYTPSKTLLESLKSRVFEPETRSLCMTKRRRRIVKRSVPVHAMAVPIGPLYPGYQPPLVTPFKWR
ncbi:unnamed protein product [Allacma fusca]|uniref:Uncharacterized protein n=1 Tax=Allacma fusca TaxID=39272 RepID=A0A8J2JAZ5_9HEXA|nr:unnamed protein product [Allacma fusca]